MSLLSQSMVGWFKIANVYQDTWNEFCEKYISQFLNGYVTEPNDQKKKNPFYFSPKHITISCNPNTWGWWYLSNDVTIAVTVHEC